MTQNPSEPQNEPLLSRIVKFILPVENDEEFPPSDEGHYWADCRIAFQEGLALGVLKPDLARRLLEEISSERAEQEQPLFGLVQRGEGGQPPSLSDMDALTKTHLAQAAEETAGFVRKELGLRS